MSGDEPGSSYDPAAASHRALREIRRELERHPAVREAQGFPEEPYAHVQADLDPPRLGRDVDAATLTVRWFHGSTPEASPEFSFHYSDDGGLDFGWHHEPNPHVHGWGHYQERSGASADYSYESYEFSTVVPARVVWELLTELGRRLSEQ